MFHTIKDSSNPEDTNLFLSDVWIMLVTADLLL